MSLKYKLSDWAPGAEYASGVTKKNEWIWKKIDQPFVDRLNAAWDKAHKFEADQLKLLKGKARGK